MKEQLQQVFQHIIRELGVTDGAAVVSAVEDPKHGEYTSTIALRFAKALKKSPMDIALQVKDVLETHISSAKANHGDHKIGKQYQNDSEKTRKDNELQDIYSVLRHIDRVEIAPPGFVNVFLSEARLSSLVDTVLKEKERYGAGQTKESKLMVEYTDPNPFKELHIGHLYSNAVGESLARLYEKIGWNVKRADYFGDVGMHVAKSIWGMKKNTSDFSSMKHRSLSERVRWLGQCYAQGTTMYEEKTPEAEKAREEMKDINYMVYLAAQEYMQKELGWTPQIEYRQYVAVAPDVYEEVKLLFETGRKWSMDYFEGIFRRLGTTFDYYYPESIVGEYGAKLVREHVGTVFEESDGAIVYRGEKDGLHTRVFMNALGLPTYEAKELGLNWKKFQDYQPDLSFNVTGNEINEYFKVLFAVMHQVIPDVAKKTRHIGHGMVRLPEGKMSSRTGKILSGEWLLEEVKKSIYDLLNQNKSEYTKELQDEIAEKAAIAAIKYSMLRVALPANIAFDFHTSLSFDGDSGPYLLYTYARCQSILRKAADESGNQGNNSPKPMNEEERAVARLIAFFPEVVAEAAYTLSPNVLCSYLFKLAQLYNLFYQKHTILGEPWRVTLTAATAQVLKNGLYLLGIATVERM